MSISFEQANANRGKAKDVCSQFAPVVGVGIIKIDSDFGLKVNLLKQPPAGIVFPTEVAGVPLRIVVAGEMVTYGSTP